MTHYDDCLWIIRLFNDRRRLKIYFPQNKMGIGDRYLLNRTIRKQALYFRKYEEDNKTYHSTNQTIAILDKMKGFGFRTKENPKMWC